MYYVFRIAGCIVSAPYGHTDREARIVRPPSSDRDFIRRRGSGSGSGADRAQAAVTSGMVPIAHGSDVGGSIHIQPAGAVASAIPRQATPSNNAQKLFKTPCQCTIPHNIMGTPAMSLPLGMHSSGVPIGVQIAARPAEEHLLLQLAAALEQAMPWRERTPPLHVSRLGQ